MGTRLIFSLLLGCMFFIHNLLQRGKLVAPYLSI